MKAAKEGVLAEVSSSVIGLLIAFFFAGFIILIAGKSPIAAFGALFDGAFGSTYNFARTLARVTPLIFTALAFSIPARAMQMNIGGDGQFYLGAVGTAVAALYLPQLPSPLHVLLSLMAGTASGAVWGFIPAYLKFKAGANEIILTVMFNFLAVFLGNFLVLNYFLAAGEENYIQTAIIPKYAELPNFIKGSQLSAAFFLAIVVALAAYWVLEKTVIGYELKSCGLTPLAAEDAGINVKKYILLSLTVGGAIAGMGGGAEVLGLYKRFLADFAPGIGFTGLAVGILGKNNPLGIILAALVFGVLMQGGMTMQMRTQIPLELYYIIQSVVVIVVATPNLGKLLFKK